MKRVVALMAMTVVALMLAMAVAPALAAQPIYKCTVTPTGETFFIQGAKFAHQFERSGSGTCERVRRR